MTNQEALDKYRIAVLNIEQFIEDDDWMKEIVGRLTMNQVVNSSCTTYLDWFTDETIALAELPVRKNDEKPGFVELIVNVNYHCKVEIGKYQDSSYAALSLERYEDIDYDTLVHKLKYVLRIYNQRIKDLQKLVDEEINKNLSNRCLDNAFGKELEELKALQQEADIEHAHHRADEIIVKIMEKLGYEKATELWKKIPKWYA